MPKAAAISKIETWNALQLAISKALIILERPEGNPLRVWKNFDFETSSMAFAKHKKFVAAKMIARQLIAAKAIRTAPQMRGLIRGCNFPEPKEPNA